MTGKDYKNETIRELREAANLTQGELAELVGAHTVTISRVENGHVCSFELLRSIAEKLNVEWRDLIRLENSQDQPEKKYAPLVTFAVDVV